MPKVDVYMPLFIGDYLADTARLKTIHHGAYLLLIFDYWRNGPLPDDDEILCEITNQDLKGWLKIKPYVINFFRKKGGVLIHKRIEKELKVAQQKRDRFSTRGSKAAEARWGRNPDKTDATSMQQACNKHATSMQQASVKHATSNPQAMLEDCPSYSELGINKQQPLKEVEVTGEGAAAFKNDDKRKMTDPEINLLGKIIEKRVATGKQPGKEPVENELALKNTLIRAWEKNPEELRSWRSELKKEDRIRANELRKAKKAEEEQTACNSAVELSVTEDERINQERVKFCDEVKSNLAKLSQKASDSIIQKAIEKTKKRYRGFPDSAYRPGSDIVLKEAEKIMFTEGVQKEVPA